MVHDEIKHPSNMHLESILMNPLSPLTITNFKLGKGKKRVDEMQHPSIEYAAPGSILGSCEFTPFIPLSPTVGVISHHAFQPLRQGAKLIELRVKANPSQKMVCVFRACVCVFVRAHHASRLCIGSSAL